MNGKERYWDVVVVGGGPSGIMAAGRAAALGAKVILLEKNESLGKKLLLTGGGRCNLTNVDFEKDSFRRHFAPVAKFLHSPFSRFDVSDTLDFFHTHGMRTKVEQEGRVFPVSDRSQSVLDALLSFVREGNVTVRCSSRISGLEVEDGCLSGVRFADGFVVHGRSVIVATGGKSHPETGSTGEGFAWLEALGHEIVRPDLSLVPVRIKERWVRELSGLSLADAGFSAVQGDKVLATGRGKALFTHFGLSGPAVLNLSRTVGKALVSGEVSIYADLFPGESEEVVDTRLLDVFSHAQNKKLKNALGGFVPARIASVLPQLAGVDGDMSVNAVSRAQRLSIVRTSKKMTMTVAGLLGSDRAIVTGGGIPLSQIDSKSMRSRLYPNLFLVGDMLDIDRPSGGYSLQLCWTTGWVAGSSAAQCSKE